MENPAVDHTSRFCSELTADRKPEIELGKSAMPLVHVVQKLSLARDLGTVQEIVRHAARALIGADGATFVLRDKSQCYYADEEAIAPLWKGMRFPMEACVSGWSMLNRQPAVIPDIYADSRIPADVYRPTFVKSLAMVPIRSLDPIGAIGTYWASPHSATDLEVELLQALADTTAVAIENVRIYQELEDRVRERTRELEIANEAIRNLSFIDELTGLYNRRGLYLLAEQIHRAAQRDGADQFVAYIDADGLKEINDSKGHVAGDGLLRSLAGVLKQTFRDADVIARLGGDEFCVLGTTRPGVGVISTRLAAALAEFNAARGAESPRLSASCGVSLWPPGSDETLDAVLKRADEAMYLAKRAGHHPGRPASGGNGGEEGFDD